jgi:hypothetical protein
MEDREMIYKVQAPDGSIIQVEGPDGASDEEVLRQAQSLFASQTPVPVAAQQAPAPDAPPEKRNWAAVPAEAISNLIPSAGKLATGIYDAVTSPVQTLKGVGDVAAGGVRAGLRAILPGMEAPANEDALRQDQAASAAWDALKNRYGGSEEIKRTLATDPVGALADVSSVLGGIGVAPKMAAVGKVGAAIDPVMLAAKGVKGLGNAATATVRETLGKTTGVGGESLGLAYQAGKEGGDAAKTYRETVKGNISGETVVDNARDAVETLYTNASDAYNQARAGWAGNPVPLNLAPIEKTYQDLVASTQTGKGFSKISEGDRAVLSNIGARIEEFKQLHPNPTVADLDALKQSISNIVPESPMHTQQSRMIGNMRSAVKREIGKQDPAYEKAMREYSDAMDQIKEVQKSLGLGDKTSVDSALRKLTSLTRNNVNTAYGHRLGLARGLEEASGRQLLPAIAGLANKEWMPRGIQGSTIAPATALAGVAVNPAWFGALAAESPRMVGNAAYGLGVASRYPSKAMAAMAPYGPAAARAGTALGAGGNLYQEAEALAELKRRRR